MAGEPLCFVVMPFGKKTDQGGRTIDFGRVYREIIHPAIAGAGMEPLRADEEEFGGIIHKPMFERLILCDYAVADLTTANANVFYEIGVRHGVRPASTVLMFAKDARLPFDVAPLRAVPYGLDEAGAPVAAESDRAAIQRMLDACKRERMPDSPVYDLVKDMEPPPIDRLKTDTFRQQVAYARAQKEELARARREGAEAVDRVRASLGPLDQLETGVVIDLYLSCRAVKRYGAMVELYEQMPRPLQGLVMIREQLALALNRLGRDAEAERILLDLLEERGPSSETYGVLGRVYKDRWERALQTGDKARARGELKKSLDAYRKGFETDWRDAYPGVNAVTLMEISEPPDPTRERLLPVVAYAVERRIASGRPDYWDHATRLELAVLGKRQEDAESALYDALASLREPWEAETTAHNLRLIRKSRDRRGEAVPWTEEIEAELTRAAESRQRPAATGS